MAYGSIFVIGWGDGDLYLRTMSSDGTLGNVETLSNQTDTQQDVALETAVMVQVFIEGDRARWNGCSSRLLGWWKRPRVFTGAGRYGSGFH